MTNRHALVAKMAGLAALSIASMWAADVLPKPAPAFKGKIGANRDKSSPDWPPQSSAPKGAPNSYYHVRGEQDNGEIVWASPMWITYAGR